MVTEMITLRLEQEFLKEVDEVVKENNFQSRTELIRTALRTQIEEARMKKAIKQISKLRGSSKTITTDKDLERTRIKVGNEVFNETDKQHKQRIEIFEEFIKKLSREKNNL
jgi:Arc/MetJ-type ribon-helix-helix transcriptional regulator